jgi:hypothetical protein
VIAAQGCKSSVLRAAIASLKGLKRQPAVVVTEGFWFVNVKGLRVRMAFMVSLMKAWWLVNALCAGENG